MKEKLVELIKLANSLQKGINGIENDLDLYLSEEVEDIIIILKWKLNSICGEEYLDNIEHP